MPNLLPILSLREVPIPDQVIIPIALDFVREGIYSSFRVPGTASVQVLTIAPARVFKDAGLCHALGHLPELVVPREWGHAEFFAASIVRFQDFLFEAREVVVEVGITITTTTRLGTFCGGVVRVAGIDHRGEHGGAGKESRYEEEGEGVQHLCFVRFAVGSG